MISRTYDCKKWGGAFYVFFYFFEVLFQVICQRLRIAWLAIQEMCSLQLYWHCCEFSIVQLFTGLSGPDNSDPRLLTQSDSKAGPKPGVKS